MMLPLLQHLFSMSLVLLYTLLAMVPSCHASTNLALGKPYTVSPLPGYSLSAPPEDNSSLTDGIYTKGNFWTQKTTVGWWPVSGVEILIDLEKVSVIDAITFNTARGIDSGVYYPSQIHAFVGPDRDHLLYVGDIADHADNSPGSYRIKRFKLEGIKAKGRYVLLEVVAQKGRSVFCDEIEVLRGSSDSGATGGLTVDAARELAAGLKWPAIALKQLNGFLAGNQAIPSSGKLRSLVSNGRISSDAAYAELLSVRADLLRSSFPDRPLLIEAVNPWDTLGPFISLAGVAPKQLTLTAPMGGYDHIALLVTNPKPNLRMISLSLPNLPPGGSGLTLHQVPFAKSSAAEYVADPLVPETAFSLRPGESRLIFVSLRGETVGSWSGMLQVGADGENVAIPINWQVKKVALPETLALNSVNWGYLTFNLISDRKKAAVQDLSAHHTNVVVVPPSYLKGANQKVRATLQEFLRLESYLRQHRGASKVLLGIGLGGANHVTEVGRYPFLSREWQEEFRKWYANALLAAGRAGFSESRLYVYPYDEMAGEQIDDFARLASWAKGAIPSIKFYATFGDETLKGKQWRKALPYLDIVQASDDEMLRGWGDVKAEAWIYDTAGMSRSLSPYAYYRLMSWKAFLRGYTGVGFWAYADIGEDVTAWKELERDYAVIYDGPNGSVISSRRWEAWRMGIEDYELLTMYARVNGKDAAKLMAKHVLDRPDDVSRADDVRRRILTELGN